MGSLDRRIRLKPYKHVLEIYYVWALYSSVCSIILIAFIYYSVSKWKYLNGNGARLIEYKIPENISFIKLEHIRQYDHDPSMEIMENEIEIYYSIDQGSSTTFNGLIIKIRVVTRQ